MLVRTDGDPAAFGDTVRGLVRDVRADAVIDRVTTLAAQVSESVGTERSATTTLRAFAAMLLAAVGLYGVLSHLISTGAGDRCSPGARGDRSPDRVARRTRRDDDDDRWAPDWTGRRGGRHTTHEVAAFRDRAPRPVVFRACRGQPERDLSAGLRTGGTPRDARRSPGRITQRIALESPDKKRARQLPIPPSPTPNGHWELGVGSGELSRFIPPARSSKPFRSPRSLQAAVPSRRRCSRPGSVGRRARARRAG